MALWGVARPTVVDTARLVRLPLVFTTTADVCVGFFAIPAVAMTGVAFRSSGGLLSPMALAGAVVCSALLYAFGMATNDIFDQERDRGIHPERPLPSGRLTVGYARAVAVVCAVGALGIGFGRGLVTFGLLITMIGLILLYNRSAKRWAIPGSLVMGSIRGCNILLGWAFVAGVGLATSRPGVTLPLAEARPAFVLAGYIALTTFLSTAEEEEQRWTVIASLTAILALLVWLKWPVLGRNPDPILPLGLVIFWRWVLALMDSSREVIGQHVRFLLLGIFLLDAHFLFLDGHPAEATFVMLLLLPALALGRWLRVAS